MAGTSHTNLEGFYGELSGVIASQWGENIMATVDDKLHMTETSNVQTVQGPVSWSNTSMMTFAGPFNGTSTGVNTFAGPFNVTNTNASTFAGNLEFKSGTTLRGIFDHTITANRTWTYPNISGTVTMWNVSNSAVTRYHMTGFMNLMQNIKSGTITKDSSHRRITLTIEVTGTICNSNINLPHGAVVTSIRARAQMTNVNAICEINLKRITVTDRTDTEMGSAVLSGTAEYEAYTNSISNATIDNDLYYYEIELWAADLGAGGGSFYVYAVQINYTVTEPQP